MELSLLLMEQILSMAIMILMGFAIVRLGVVRSEDSGVLAAITLNVISPCVIINAFQITFSMEKLKGLLLAIGAAILLHVLFILCTHFIGKAAKLNSIERASLIYSNGGNLIIPLVSALLGEEAVFYSCAFIAVQNVLLWTHAVSLISAQKRRNLKKIVTNPNMIAIAVGLTLFLCRITLPETAGQYRRQSRRNCRPGVHAGDRNDNGWHQFEAGVLVSARLFGLFGSADCVSAAVDFGISHHRHDAAFSGSA